MKDTVVQAAGELDKGFDPPALGFGHEDVFGPIVH
jgi:hypothetical protein